MRAAERTVLDASSSHPLVSVSILAGCMHNLGLSLQDAIDAGCDMIHLDVMDGHFAPNLTFGAGTIKALKGLAPSAKFDTHLMISNPERYIEEYAEAGSDFITVHAEACTHLERVLKRIRSCGCKAGVALTPSTSFEFLRHIIDSVDIVLVMTVNPGFCGQEFLPLQLHKIKGIRNMVSGMGYSDVKISVDGGINPATGKMCTASGADILVSGAYILGQSDHKIALQNLKKCAYEDS